MYWALAGMAVFGREPWTRAGEGFAVAFGLLARIASFAVRDGKIVVRWPLTGLAGADRTPGALVFLAVMLGSTSFDGFSRTTSWQNLLGDVRSKLVHESLRLVELATTLVNIAGLLVFIAVVALTYLAAISGAGRLVRSPRSLAPDFLLPLVPIVFAYLVAHYFSLLAYNGQDLWRLASDPLGDGSDLLGGAGGSIDYSILSATAIWYVQALALVAGHVAALVLAHDRALAMYQKARAATTSQYWMLAVMVAFTTGGLFLLSQANQ